MKLLLLANRSGGWIGKQPLATRQATDNRTDCWFNQSAGFKEKRRNTHSDQDEESLFQEIPELLFCSNRNNIFAGIDYFLLLSSSRSPVGGARRPVAAPVGLYVRVQLLLCNSQHHQVVREDDNRSISAADPW